MFNSIMLIFLGIKYTKPVSIGEFSIEFCCAHIFFNILKYIRYLFGQRGEYINDSGMYFWVSRSKLLRVQRSIANIQLFNDYIRVFEHLEIIRDSIKDDTNP